MAGSYWSRMTPEQKAKHLARSKAWRDSKKTCKIIKPLVPEVKLPEAKLLDPDDVFTPVDLSRQPDEKTVKTAEYTYHMKKHRFNSKHGIYVGYKTVKVVRNSYEAA